MKTKTDYINELIQTAQDNVWKNELVLKFHELGLSNSATPLNISATKEVIERDKAYIQFLIDQK